MQGNTALQGGWPDGLGNVFYISLLIIIHLNCNLSIFIHILCLCLFFMNNH